MDPAMVFDPSMAEEMQKMMQLTAVSPGAGGGGESTSQSSPNKQLESAVRFLISELENGADPAVVQVLAMHTLPMLETGEEGSAGGGGIWAVIEKLSAFGAGPAPDIYPPASKSISAPPAEQVTPTAPAAKTASRKRDSTQPPQRDTPQTVSSSNESSFSTGGGEESSHTPTHATQKIPITPTSDSQVESGESKKKGERKSYSRFSLTSGEKLVRTSNSSRRYTSIRFDDPFCRTGSQRTYMSVRSAPDSEEPIYGTWSPFLMRCLQEKFNLSIDQLQHVQKLLLDAKVPLRRPLDRVHVDSVLESQIGIRIMAAILGHTVMVSSKHFKRPKFAVSTYQMTQKGFNDWLAFWQFAVSKYKQVSPTVSAANALLAEISNVMPQVPVNPLVPVAVSTAVPPPAVPAMAAGVPLVVPPPAGSALPADFVSMATKNFMELMQAQFASSPPTIATAADPTSSSTSSESSSSSGSSSEDSDGSGSGSDESEEGEDGEMDDPPLFADMPMMGMFPPPAALMTRPPMGLGGFGLPPPGMVPGMLPPGMMAPMMPMPGTFPPPGFPPPAVPVPGGLAMAPTTTAPAPDIDVPQSSADQQQEPSSSDEEDAMGDVGDSPKKARDRRRKRRKLQLEKGQTAVESGSANKIAKICDCGHSGVSGFHDIALGEMSRLRTNEGLKFLPNHSVSSVGHKLKIDLTDSTHNVLFSEYGLGKTFSVAFFHVFCKLIEESPQVESAVVNWLHEIAAKFIGCDVSELALKLQGENPHIIVQWMTNRNINWGAPFRNVCKRLRFLLPYLVLQIRNVHLTPEEIDSVFDSAVIKDALVGSDPAALAASKRRSSGGEQSADKSMSCLTNKPDTCFDTSIEVHPQVEFQITYKLESLLKFIQESLKAYSDSLDGGAKLTWNVKISLPHIAKMAASKGSVGTMTLEVSALFNGIGVKEASSAKSVLDGFFEAMSKICHRSMILCQAAGRVCLHLAKKILELNENADLKACVDRLKSATNEHPIMDYVNGVSTPELGALCLASPLRLPYLCLALVSNLRPTVQETARIVMEKLAVSPPKPEDGPIPAAEAAAADEAAARATTVVGGTLNKKGADTLSVLALKDKMERKKKKLKEKLAMYKPDPEDPEAMAPAPDEGAPVSALPVLEPGEVAAPTPPKGRMAELRRRVEKTMENPEKFGRSQKLMTRNRLAYYFLRSKFTSVGGKYDLKCRTNVNWQLVPPKYSISLALYFTTTRRLMGAHRSIGRTVIDAYNETFRKLGTKTVMCYEGAVACGLRMAAEALECDVSVKSVVKALIECDEENPVAKALQFYTPEELTGLANRDFTLLPYFALASLDPGVTEYQLRNAILTAKDRNDVELRNELPNAIKLSRLRTGFNSTKFGKFQNKDFVFPLQERDDAEVYEQYIPDENKPLPAGNISIQPGQAPPQFDATSGGDPNAPTHFRGRGRGMRGMRGRGRGRFRARGVRGGPTHRGFGRNLMISGLNSYAVDTSYTSSYPGRGSSYSGGGYSNASLPQGFSNAMSMEMDSSYDRGGGSSGEDEYVTVDEVSEQDPRTLGSNWCYSTGGGADIPGYSGGYANRTYGNVPQMYDPPSADGGSFNAAGEFMPAMPAIEASTGAPRRSRFSDRPNPESMDLGGNASSNFEPKPPADVSMPPPAPKMVPPPAGDTSGFKVPIQGISTTIEKSCGCIFQGTNSDLSASIHDFLIKSLSTLRVSAKGKNFSEILIKVIHSVEKPDGRRQFKLAVKVMKSEKDKIPLDIRQCKTESFWVAVWLALGQVRQGASAELGAAIASLWLLLAARYLSVDLAPDPEEGDDPPSDPLANHKRVAEALLKHSGHSTLVEHYVMKNFMLPAASLDAAAEALAHKLLEKPHLTFLLAFHHEEVQQAAPGADGVKRETKIVDDLVTTFEQQVAAQKDGLLDSLNVW